MIFIFVRYSNQGSRVPLFEQGEDGRWGKSEGESLAEGFGCLCLGLAERVGLGWKLRLKSDVGGLFFEFLGKWIGLGLL